MIDRGTKQGNSDPLENRARVPSCGRPGQGFVPDCPTHDSPSDHAEISRPLIPALHQRPHDVPEIGRTTGAGVERAYTGPPDGSSLMLDRKLVLVSLLYFAEGFPFGIIEQCLPVYFRIHGMSLVHLGLLSLLTLPYALKFLWAPAVDFIGIRRQWIGATQLLMAGAILLMIPLDPAEPSTVLWVVLLSLAILSATQDIAIDAYTIELLKPSELGLANGFRQASYRVALIMAGGIFVAVGGGIGWELAYAMAAGILVLCCVLTFRLPPVEVQRPRFSFNSLVAPAKDFLARRGVISVILFILLYKLGDMSAGPMVRPFWLDRGLTTTEIGLINGTLGIFAAVAGGLIGGLFMARYGIFHGIWFLGIWQSASNLTYTWVAADPSTGNWGIYVASVVESFCAGLGTAAFLAFLMSICKKEFSATQYALLSAIFRVSGIMAGALSGWTTEKLMHWATDGSGYAWYFALTFLFSLPAFAFLGAVKRWIPDDREVGEENG
jgi:MFS transporter, PAT family, beta-lactamase induction signal transducer AmpG